MKFKRAALTCTILAGAAALVAGGCGVVTAPISVPRAIGENSFFSISGPIVDVSGKSIEHVIVNQQRNHRLWEPAFGGTTNNYETRIRAFNGNYEANERGNELELKFTHDDFKEAKITLKNDSKVIETPLGDWPETKKFPVVMFGKNEKDAAVRSVGLDFDYTDYPKQQTIEVFEADLREVTRDIEAKNVPPGNFFVTIRKEPPKPINAKGDLDPIDINLPGEIVLRFGKQEKGEYGFAPFTPRLGFAPLQTMDEAPEAGYKPLTIDRKRLKEMRAAGKRNLTAAYEYFYFKTGELYGKGCIRWARQVDNETGPRPVVFHVELISQAKAGVRDLKSRGISPPFSD
jgi:hypothetical protein